MLAVLKKMSIIYLIYVIMELKYSLGEKEWIVKKDLNKFILE